MPKRPSFRSLTPYYRPKAGFPLLLVRKPGFPLLEPEIQQGAERLLLHLIRVEGEVERVLTAELTQVGHIDSQFDCFTRHVGTQVSKAQNIATLRYPRTIEKDGYRTIEALRNEVQQELTSTRLVFELRS